MTLLFERPVVGAKTHAFVIGVGSYPNAKGGVEDILRNVPDLPSAADSSKLMCDWLLDNQDRLAAPLATLEVLISDPVEPNNRFQWNAGPVEPATEVNILAAGGRWFTSLESEPGSVAFFYCCGHGAAHRQEPVLFLEDLNRDRRNAWTYLNLGSLAHVLRKTPAVSAAFMFSDACGEYVAEFELRNAQDTRFFPEPPLFGPSRNQVSLLCAAAEGQLAYEGEMREGDTLKFGRFTQTVIKGLDGSSSRLLRNQWAVHPRGLLSDLKSLRRVQFQHWKDDYPFEPYPAVAPTDDYPIVFPVAFELPVVIMTDPADRMPEYGLYICDHDDPNPPWVRNRDAGERNAWWTTVPAGHNPLYAIAANNAGHHSRAFMPKEPLFDQWVPVP